MLARVLSPLREFGVVAGLVYSLDRLCHRLRVPIQLFFYALTVQPLAGTARLPSSLAKSIEVREIGPGDPELAEMPVAAERLAQRFAQPTVCLGAFRKSRLTGYLWLCLGPYQEDEVRCVFEPQPAELAAWDFDVYVFPEFRLGPGFVALWDGASAYLRSRGYRFTCSRVSRFNPASLRAHKHFRTETVGQALFVHARRFQAMIATVRPYVHIAFNGSSRPTVPVSAGALARAAGAADDQASGGEEAADPGRTR